MWIAVIYALQGWHVSGEKFTWRIDHSFRVVSQCACEFHWAAELKWLFVHTSDAQPLHPTNLFQLFSIRSAKWCGSLLSAFYYLYRFCFRWRLCSRMASPNKDELAFIPTKWRNQLDATAQLQATLVNGFGSCFCSMIAGASTSAARITVFLPNLWRKKCENYLIK